MPSADTFSVKPIGEFVKRYLAQSKVSIDPFARNKRWATHTNDLNPETAAEYHLEAQDFLAHLKAQGVTADLAIFDPPYSITQVSLAYKGFGLKFKGKENPTGGFPMVRQLISEILTADGIALSFWMELLWNRKEARI